MAVKTITIDLNAYEILARHKRAGQSFSQVIKEHFGRTKTGKDLLPLLAGIKLSEEALDAIAAQVKARRRSVARGVKL